MIKHLIAILFLSLIPFAGIFGENPLWLRYAAISPDGKTILFCYQGDLWSVPSTGGTATPLTMTESYEYLPV
jgi:hypothetical protein